MKSENTLCTRTCTRKELQLRGPKALVELNATMTRIEFIFPSWNELNLQRSGRIAAPLHRA